MNPRRDSEFFTATIMSKPHHWKQEKRFPLFLILILFLFLSFLSFFLCDLRASTVKIGACD
jgi:hypothetical protein